MKRNGRNYFSTMHPYFLMKIYFYLLTFIWSCMRNYLQLHLNASGILSNNTICLQMLRNNRALNRMQSLIQLFCFCIPLFPIWVWRSSLPLWCQWLKAVYVYVHYHRISRTSRQVVSTAGIEALLYSMSLIGMGEQTHSSSLN